MNETTRKELMNFPNHFHKQLGVEYRRSKNFVEACKNGVSKLIVDFSGKLRMFQPQIYRTDGVGPLIPNIVRKEISKSNLGQFRGEKRYLCHYNYMHLIKLESKSVLYILVC